MTSAGTWVHRGFAAIALLEASINGALFRMPRDELAVVALALAFSIGHVLFVGLVIGAMGDVAGRLLPQRGRPWSGVALAFVVAVALAAVVCAEDYQVFATPLRVGLIVLTAVPFALVVAARPWLVAAKWRAGLALVVALALAVQNPLVLDAHYTGMHLTATWLAGISCGVALEGLAPSRSTSGRVAHVVPVAIACLVAAASVTLWPTNAVVLLMSRYPTASCVTWLGRWRTQASAGSLDAVPPTQREWFEDRREHAPIPPTEPAIYGGDPIVLLITVDALRADVVARKRYKATTPNIRRIARKGTIFSDARSTAASTYASVGPMFTGKYCSSLYWTKGAIGPKVRYLIADDDSVRFPELLAAGTRRTAFLPWQGLDPALGLTRGFDEHLKSGAYSFEMVPEIERWLSSVGVGPAFLWAHFMDPHYPYDQGAKEGKSFRRYLSEVAIADEQIGRLYKAIVDQGLAERTFLFISADHGEAFGEHGTTKHGASVYEELIHVPLVVVGPGVAKQRVAEPVSTIDLSATILDIFQRPVPGHFMGQSMVPLLAGRPAKLSRPIVVDAGRRKQAMVFPDRLKVIRDLHLGTVELYDLAQDPKELVNLADDPSGEAARRLDALAAFFAVHQLERAWYTAPFRD